MRRACGLFLVPCFAAGVRSINIHHRAVPSAISISSTPTHSSTSATPTPIAAFYFYGVPQLTTCERATFTWSYSGPASKQLALSITNNQVEQSNAPNGSTFSPVDIVIADNIDPSLGTYTWQSVNVPSAWYKLNATISSQTLSVSSTVFYVYAGSNITCLAGSSSAQAYSSRSHTKMGAIVGGTLGGVVLALFAALVCLFYTRKSKKSQSVSPSNPYTEDRKRGRNALFSPTRSWDQLGSIDSHMLVSPPATNDTSGSRASHQQHSIHSAAHKSFSDSVSLPVLEYSRNVSRASLNGDEEKGSPTSIYSYKSPIDSGPLGAVDNDGLPHASISRLPKARLDAHAVPEQAHTQDSRLLEKTYAAHLDGVNNAYSARKRKPSDTSSLAASTIMSLVTATDHGSGRSSPIASAVPHHRSQTSLTRKSASPTFSTPAASSSTPISLSKPRKAVRKPVPLYDPSTDPDYINNTSVSSSFAQASSSPEILTPSSPTNANHPLYTEDPFARPIPVLTNKGSTGSLNGSPTTSSGHYVSRSQGSQRELAHKNSFGFEGRQMHYLIPDMPLPQKK